MAGTIAETYQSRWPARILDGEITEQDVHKFRKLAPGQNLFYWRRGVNWLEGELVDALE